MAIQTPLVLISGAFSSLPPGDTIPASDPVAQASGNAALVLANTALASGNAGISTGLTALASGNAGISTGLTALASGNAGISTGLTALASGNAGISTGLTALASGNAGLVSASNKVPISGGYMTGQLFAASGVVVSGTLTVGLNSATGPSLVFTGDPNTGLYSPGVDQVAISTGGTGRVFVDASGNVGVGTGSPSVKFHVDGARAIISDGTGTDIGLSIGTSSSSTGTNYGAIDLNGLSYCGIHLRTTNVLRTSLFQTSVSTSLETNTNIPLIFTTNNIECARATSDQKFLVGTIASPAHQLQVSTDSAGKPSTTTWTVVSDERIKEDIELADLDLCYEAVKAIPLKRYKWRDDIYTAEQVTDRRKLGWIAQDVEAVFPKAVGIYDFKYNQIFEEVIIPASEELLDDEGNVIASARPERIEKGELISEDVIEDCRDLNSDQIYAAMYGAIQKLIIKVETLETELAALKVA